MPGQIGPASLTGSFREDSGGKRPTSHPQHIVCSVLEAGRSLTNLVTYLTLSSSNVCAKALEKSRFTGGLLTWGYEVRSEASVWPAGFYLKIAQKLKGLESCVVIWCLGSGTEGHRLFVDQSKMGLEIRNCEFPRLWLRNNGDLSLLAIVGHWTEKLLWPEDLVPFPSISFSPISLKGKQCFYWEVS